VRRSRRQAGIKGFQIGMDITEQQYAHESPDELPIIDRTGILWDLSLNAKSPYRKMGLIAAREAAPPQSILQSD
jgi:hypothetical protein